MASRAQGSRAQGFCSCGSWALETGLAVVLWGAGAWTELLLGMWDLPRAGIKPRSPTLAGGFFTTEPPGKPEN